MVEDLGIPTGGEAIVEAIALYDRLGARIAAAVAEFEPTRVGVDAAMSMTSWLQTHGRMTRRAAGRLARHARRLRHLPVTSTAYAHGVLSGGQVETILAFVGDDMVEVFAAHEAELVPYLAPLTVAGTARAMAAWKLRAAPEPAEPSEPDRSVYLSQTIDGRYVLNGDLDPEGGSLVAAALRLAAANGNDATLTPARRRGDALVDICRYFMDYQHTGKGGRHRPHVNVVVELDDLLAGRGSRVVDGPVLDGPTTSKLFCDSAVHRVVTSGRSAIIDFGHSTRTIPVTLWNALVVRDEGCRFPGCDRPSRWCEGHHVTWVTHGGPTDLGNFVLMCPGHHHWLHQPGWHAKLRSDGELTVTDPQGETRCTSPPRSQLLPI